MAPVRVGVIGYGSSAKNFHLAFITSIPDYEVVAILQRTPPPEDLASAPPGSHCTIDYPQARHHRTADEFFADDAIQLVVVASRGDTHALFAERALRAGKHALVDKPFARSTEEADRVIRLAKEKDLLVTCFQNRRWDGDFQTLKHLVSQNALGKVLEAEIRYDFESPPGRVIKPAKYNPGDGFTFGLGSHTIDQAMVLFGPPKSVTGFLRRQRCVESEVEDAYTIILQYGGEQQQLIVTVKTCVITPLSKQFKFLVRGTEGSYIKFQQRASCPQEEHIEKGMKPLDPGFGDEPEAMHGILTTYKEFDGRYQKLDPEVNKYTGRYPTVPGRWLGLYENVLNAINGKEDLIVQASHSRDAIRVIELARESDAKGATIPWE